MSDGLDQLARLLADGVIAQLRAEGKIPSAGPSWTGDSNIAAAPSAASAKPIPPGLCPQPLWHPDAPRSFDNARVAKGEVPIGVSARHCHVTQEALEVLFGKGAKLTFFKPLMQKGEFAAKEKIDVVGPGGKIEGVRILGPTRNLNQVEVAVPDLRALGLKAPVRPSGTHDGSPGATLVGPTGAWTMPTGVIRANRHIHLSPKNAADLGLKENDVVAVHIPGGKPATLYDVQIRVRDTFVAQFHLDTDDGNAMDATDGESAFIVEKLGSLKK